MMKNVLISIFFLFVLAACKEDEPDVEQLVRGLKTYEVSEVERVSIRRFPGILEPSELIYLSFEASGTIAEINLDVGQRVEAGDIVANLDPVSLQIQVENAAAGVNQARAVSESAIETLERQEELFERGSTTRVSVDNARTEAQSAAAALEQSRKALETAENALEKATLVAPFDGIVNSVDATSYATLSAGTPVASVYTPDSFTVSFSVNFETVDRLVVGKTAVIRLADRPEIALNATVSEIGSRADAVSSFPIVVKVDETNPLMKAGMAVEVSIEFELPRDEGFPIPLSAIIRDGQTDQVANGDGLSKVGVFVFDQQTSTVKRREVTIGGIRENAIIVLDGLEPGDLVASAGVAFLTNGLEVKLLRDEG